ncbi:MAG TPA: substrate-binding domain-containing protein [Candidatus Sulfotelmatobacter sp.]|nr:substrate-binding domain-containing protein [Candidatus Sulfotelmatobacter sp.]
MLSTRGGWEQTPIRAFAYYSGERLSTGASRHCAASCGSARVDLQTLFADNDAIQQSTHILNVIQSGNSPTDAILVEPASQTAFPKVTRAAVAAGTAWAILNSNAEYLKDLRSAASVPVFSVSADNRQVGRIQGQWLAALLPGGGCVLYVQGPSSSSVAAQRTAGMMATKPFNVTVKTLRSSDWTEDGGCHAVSSWLRLSTARNERIDAVQAQNDFLALGARRAMEQETSGSERERRTRLPFLGVDGLPRTGQAWVRQGSLTATVVVPPTAAQALGTLVAALRDGIQPPESTLVSPNSFPEPKILAAKPTTDISVQKK